MNQLSRAAMGAAIALSVVSIGDAVVRAASDEVPPWDPDVAPGWVIAGITVVEAATFLLLAAVLEVFGRQIDDGSRARTVVRHALAVDLVVLTVGVVLANGGDGGVLGVVAGVAFLAMFLLGLVLGALLLRRREYRPAAVLMVAPVGLLLLAFAVDALVPGWGHPGYAETALYVGIALLGLRSATAAAAAAPSPAVTAGRP
jgi:peptidoglycan/LPS O-acetylase OafA/YrhL